MPFQCFDSVAGSAGSPASISVGVFWRVLVPLWAVSLERVVFSGVAAANVVFVKNCFEVSRIAARKILAQVIDFPSCWNSTNQQLIGHSMSSRGFSVKTHIPVSTAAFASSPDPATSLGINSDFLSDSFREEI